MPRSRLFHIPEKAELNGDIYHWFTEGFDTTDLKDAKAVLDEFSK